MERPESRSGHGTAVGSFGLSEQQQQEEEEEEEARKPPRWTQQRGNWLATHPTLTRMMSLNAADSSSVYAAFLVYLDLLEARNWHEVSYIGLAEFQLVCLHGREREAEDLQVVVPTPVHVSFSHERIRQIMKKVHTGEDKPDSSLSFMLAIVESDSTIVYYKLTDGFVTPDPPDDTEDTDNKQWRKKRKRFLRQ
ncbi:tRNA-splicing endonuclease subunit Sen15 [Tiliqua scincoides]|uniref:tRNA-splicing endonuclease subunit Sen15 n=1 Tax=Tiliqua scincoides TaxID=71010 RepID=UPI003461B3C0